VTATWKCEGKPVRLLLALPAGKGREYTTAHFGKVDSPPFKFILAEDNAKDGSSEFVALWQPFEGEPFIEKVERLPVEGANEPEGFEPVAIRVTLAGNQVDTLIYTFDPDAKLRIGDIEFQGSFGYVSEQNGKLRCMHLVNGRCLTKGGDGIKNATPSYRAKITAADLADYRLTLDTPLPADGTLDGRQMNILSGGEHRTSYRIARVLPPGNIVQLDQSSKIFQSKLESVGSAAKKITCEIAPPTEAVRKFPPGYYNGALLTDESRTARYRVVRVDKKDICLDRPPNEADFQTLDSFGRRMVHIFDFGEGDEITVPMSIFMRRDTVAK
jgi:hypothetical protein